MVAVLLGLSIAAGFGSGDYVGGRASTTASPVAVLVIAQCVSVVGALVLVVSVQSEWLAHDVAFGMGAGIVNVVGLVLLYDALARHAAGVVAPVTAVVASILPVTWALARGERPSIVTMAGAVLAIVAGALVARESGPAADRALARGAAQAVLAGLALGSSLILYASTSTRSGQWPLLAARSAGLLAVVIAALVLARRGALRPVHGRARPLAAAAGALDVAATALLVFAVRRELVVVVAPLVALAPAVTVLLAWRLDGEQLHRAQRAGLALALAGLVLVAVG